MIYDILYDKPAYDNEYSFNILIPDLDVGKFLYFPQRGL